MKEDINDNEIRLIGVDDKNTHKEHKRWIWIVSAAIVIVVGVVLAIYLPRKTVVTGVEDTNEYGYDEANVLHPLKSWLYSYDDCQESGCAIKDTTVNDIDIRIYLPLNAVPALEVGLRPLLDNNVILAFQAADVRADNGKIVGAFVEKGKPIAWGLSKKGYCAILRGKIYVGVADNSPLFEEATDCKGYFFRQYPLVKRYVPQENELKTQSIRRALCEVDGHIVCVETKIRTGMHDFAVLLADLGVVNAIYLTGSDSMGTVTDLEGNRTQIGNLVEKPYKYTNFIYWTKQK